MPAWCMVPGCDSYRKKREDGVSRSFHRLPTDVERCKEWLRAIKSPKYDEDAPTSVLGNLRVCSLHFAAGDYNRDMQSEMMGGTIKKLLKTSAVPTLFGGDIGHGEGESREKRGRAETGEQTARTATVSVPSCGTETRPVAAAAHSPGGLVPELQDTRAVMERPPGQVRSTGIQVNVAETCTAATEKPTLQYIVDEEAILQLMKNCPMCNRTCRCSKRTCGPYFIVYQSCYFCHYQRKWASQPEARNMNTHKTHAAPKRKLQPKDKVSANAKDHYYAVGNT